MSSNPTTFHGEPAGPQGIDWNDSSDLLKKENGGVDFRFHTMRNGTFAELIAFVMTLPEKDQPQYVIQKSGDRRFEIEEIRELARHPDFPGA